MNCIFICIFNQEQYVDMFYLLLESIFLYGNLDDNTDILIYTSNPFMDLIKQNHLFNGKKMKFETNDTYDNVDKACKARLDLFHLSSIINYEKVLYLDTDILVKDNINKVFDVCKEDILYVLEEGTIDGNPDYWGKTLFGNEIGNYTDKTAFSSGILLFNNCEKIRELFHKITEDIINRPYYFSCYDQPYIIYSAITYNLYDNKILKSLVVNRDNNIHSDKVIHHFPGGPGIYEKKIYTMITFLNSIKEFNAKNKLIKDILCPPLKNTSLPLVGICVSYNYFDTLKFTLPVNYLHFDTIYLITQQDDVETIEFCEKFDNVNVLFYNFKNNNKVFDKFGALNYAQQLAYEVDPESWYLIIDSDILLPNNMIDILTKEDLNQECMYGGVRNNVLKTSELLDKNKSINSDKNKNWCYNNILHHVDKPPSILGCFQLYKKKCLHRRNNLIAGYGDYYFGYDNFNLFCNLENILYFHLGETGVNWYGKATSFIDDVNISLNNLYYTYNKFCNNVCYNKEKQVVQYGDSKDIYHDIWTCSEKMRFDIGYFFKDNSCFKIAEIGSHKGYSTKILSKIFSKVYAVDNSIEWTNFNKDFNKDATNIEYVMLDLYKDSWEILPNDIEVTFIDADHSYNGCKSDIFNSINRFENLKFIILDDYGVWNGVKQIVDELIENKTLNFVRFVGINDVPGPNGVVKNVNEGIICSINKVIINNLENKTYTWGDSSISFLENFKMDAFGKGYYKFIDEQNIIAYFGCREHDIKFNSSYTSFVSTRRGNLSIVTGNLKD